MSRNIYRGDPREYAVYFGSHYEVVLVQTLNLLGLQRDSRVAPAKTDIGVMAFGFCEFTNLLDKTKCLPEILERSSRSDERPQPSASLGCAVERKPISASFHLEDHEAKNHLGPVGDNPGGSRTTDSDCARSSRKSHHESLME
jgi:hypothetical protein